MMPRHHYIWPNTHIDAGWAILWITTLSKLLGSRLTEKTIRVQLGTVGYRMGTVQYSIVQYSTA